MLEEKDKRIISNRGGIVGIHNHPTNLLPNGSDFTAAGSRKYSFGVIVTHDGKVIKYSVGDKPFFSQNLDARIDKYCKKEYGLTIEEAYIRALSEYGKEYGISWMEM